MDKTEHTEPLLTFEDELAKLINKYSLESLSNTPDFILAWYLKDCLLSYNNAIQRRTEWFKQRAAKDESDRVSQIAPLS